jgi:hypothetical protein
MSSVTQTGSKTTMFMDLKVYQRARKLHLHTVVHVDGVNWRGRMTSRTRIQMQSICIMDRMSSLQTNTLLSELLYPPMCQFAQE